MHKNKYSILCNFYRRITNLANITGILYWDTATMMPKAVAKYRAEDAAALQKIIHQLLSSNQLGDILESVDVSNLNNWQQANVKEIRRIRNNTLSLDSSLVESLTKATTECTAVWSEAKKNNDFKMLLPYFKKVVSLSKKSAKLKAEYLNTTPYAALLDQYDPKRQEKEIKHLCDDLRKFLPSFIQKVIDKQKSTKIHSFQHNQFTEKQQRELSLYCMKKLGFDFSRGRLDTSSHPFCGGNTYDTRITTRYEDNNFLSGLNGVIHETGHALYQQNLPEDYRDQPVGEAKGMSLHESQSLLYEIQIGRSKEFIEFIQPQICKIFGVSGKEFSINNIYNSLNKVAKSFIRVDADEVTYPAHIILRFDLEKEIIDGNLKISDLPGAWSDGMEKFLNIKPDTDTKGCLQDIHWPSGMFGYFPTYLVGSILAAQFFDKIKKDIPSTMKDIKSGNMEKVKNWLKENIHSNGSLYSVSDLVVNATGRNTDSECYKNYLKSKYI